MNSTNTTTRSLRASLDAPVRLDLYIKEAAGIGRAYARALIDKGRVRVNSQVQAKYHRLVRNGDKVEFETQTRVKMVLQPFETPLDILYEDKSILAVNKPAGMLVHPTKFQEQTTLVNAVMGKYPSSTIHCINRLDKLTSGIVLFALDKETAKVLSDMIKKRKVYKEYSCLVHGRISKKGVIDLELSKGGGGVKLREVVQTGGREALTGYEPAKYFDKATLLKVVIKTGRTHQIRVHMKYIGHPVAGDPVYGDRALDEKLFGAGNIPAGQLLHATVMEFEHPKTGAKIRVESKVSFEKDVCLTGLKGV